MGPTSRKNDVAVAGQPLEAGIAIDVQNALKMGQMRGGPFGLSIRRKQINCCRRHGIVTSMLFRWRVQFGFGRRAQAKLARVEVANDTSGAPSPPLVLHDLLQAPEGMRAVDLADGRRVFAPADADPDVVRRHVADRETAP